MLGITKIFAVITFFLYFLLAVEQAIHEAASVKPAPQEKAYPVLETRPVGEVHF